LFNAVVITGYLQEGHEDDEIPFIDPQPLLDDFDDYEDLFDRSTTPDFLPPLPDDTSRARSVSPTPTPHTVKLEKPPSLIPQHITSNTVSDYVTQVNYSESVLATTPEWHLPSRPPTSAISRKQPPHLPTPQTAQALLQAYHHILTHPVPPPAPPNPLKHKVATTLLSQVQNNPRWNPPDTLYANIVPCPPRVAVIGPSYPVPQSTLDDIRAGKDDKDSNNKPIFPSAPPRPVFSADKPVFLVSQQSSRLPDLARQILPVSRHFACSFDVSRRHCYSPQCSRAPRVSHIHLYYSGATRNSITAPVSTPLGTHLHQGRPPAGKVKTRVQPTDAATNLQRSHYPTHKCSLRGISRQRGHKRRWLYAEGEAFLRPE
jgi:hypothetical protein